MKIAIVGPSPVPFTIGGAENLLWGLCETINQKTSHQAEIIKLPSREFDFWNLIDNYYAFYKLDLDHFDMVISTKYPSWMVQHRNSICYMVHTLRGLYDTYHLMNLPFDVDRRNEKINVIMEYMDKHPQPLTLDDFFVMIFELKRNIADVPKEYFAFPGPFIRRLVHYMDNYGLSQGGVKQFYAISDTVRKRKEYFPINSKVEVVYPPSKMNTFTSGEYQYIFMISRLDSPKRINMLIEAMKYVTNNVRLLIAGTGPQEQELKKLAHGDNRIEFLGFVNDDDVEKYYANCLVVPYFPYDEDYGLITIEAMMHKKPVITTLDAGGPTEFVINNETGFVTKFNPKAIGEKIDYLAKNPDEAKRMGMNAFNQVKKINWDTTVKELLKDVNLEMKIAESKPLLNTKEERKKITVVSTFPIFPPQGGGQARTYHLYKNLAKEYDIEIVSFTNADQKEYNGFIAPNLKEIRIPKSIEHQNKEWELESKIGIPISDIAMISLAGYTAKYGDELKHSIEKSNIVVLSHPYLYNEVMKYITKQKIIYEAQDVESVIKKEMLPNSNVAQKLVKQVFEIEKECCEKSDLIMVCAKEDLKTINSVYDISVNKMIIVPNGVDCNATYFTSTEERLDNKQRLGLFKEKIGLFMGSWHKPNLEACEEIIKIAPKCPDTTFLLMGSQCSFFAKQKLPQNIGLLGVVEDNIKNLIFSSVDFALNPMLSGSGTNLKMFDYMSAGIPIITTEFGTRGIKNKDLFIIGNINEFPELITDYDLLKNVELVEEARKYTTDNFSWEYITQDLIAKLRVMR